MDRNWLDNVGIKIWSITKITLVCNKSWHLFSTCHLHSLCRSFAILFHLILLSPFWGRPWYRFISQTGKLKPMGVEYSLDKEVVVHIHNRIVLSHKNEHIWLRSNKIDKPRAYCTEWKKLERERQISHINAYVSRNLECIIWI